MPIFKWLFVKKISKPLEKKFIVVRISYEVKQRKVFRRHSRNRQGLFARPPNAAERVRKRPKAARGLVRPIL